MSTFMHDLFFGKPPSVKEEAAHKEWREAIHDSRNASQASIAAARISKRSSDEAFRVAMCAIKILEQSHLEKDDKANEG